MPLHTTIIDRTKKDNLHHQAVIENALLKGGYYPYSNAWVICEFSCAKCSGNEIIYYAGLAQINGNVRPVKISADGKVKPIREDGLTDGMLLDIIRSYL